MSTTQSPAWINHNVIDIALSVEAGTCPLPILGDALADAGCPDAIVAECMTGTTMPALIRAEIDAIKARHDSFVRSFFVRSGVTGNIWNRVSLAEKITRRRPRGSGSKQALATRLGEALDKLAERRWVRACKGQRVPSPRQAVELADQIRKALDTANGRCRERLMSVQQIVNLAYRADANGSTTADGGTVTANSYGYSWSTTSASATRQTDGTIRVRISRNGCSDTVTAPAKHWLSITCGSDVLAGGGVVAIRRAHGYDCLNAAGNVVGVAIATPNDVASRWSSWEHGTTIEVAKAEIVRKQGIIAAERAEKARTERQERAARLLARIGVKTEVSYEDARAVGACEAGLRAFAERNHLPLDAKLSLTQIAAIEPTWALKLARRIVASNLTSI